MIAFFDTNTVWRTKFAEALQRRRPCLRVEPTTGIHSSKRSNEVFRPLVPRGWASSLSGLAMPYLGARVKAAVRDLGGELHDVFVTTPHYLPLVRYMHGRANIFYYCSDDYRGYRGWPAERMKAQEAAICRLATGVIFVSEELRIRALKEYAIPPDTSFVSPNASEKAFVQTRPVTPPELRSLPRPIFGTAGMFNDRISYAVLLAIADQNIGSLVLVGPIQTGPYTAALLAHPRIHCFGWQPHESLPAWLSAFDVAVIPYAATGFNRFCSPMRLFDHLAVGHPIIATSACPQISNYDEVTILNPINVGDAVGKALAQARVPRISRLETWDDRVEAFLTSNLGALLTS